MGYSDPGAVFEAPGGVKVDPNDPAYDAAVVGGDPVGPDEAPIVYLFSNSPDGDGVAYAMAEDGHVLGSHFCSHWGYMKHDLHDRRDNGAAMCLHYPDGYRLQVLGPGESPPPEVYARNQALRPTDEAGSRDTERE